MRIGITCYPTFGGSGVVATELGIELARRGHEVHFITYAHPFRLPHFMERVYFHEVEVVRYPLFDHSPYPLALSAMMHDAFTRRWSKVRIAWSYKTNYLGAICRVFHRQGAWAEVVSEFEYDKAVPYVKKCTFCAERQATGGMPACVENCPTGALKFGERAALIEEARERIYQNPDKYVRHIYGEHEAGGTSWLYISDVPLETLDPRRIVRHMREVQSDFAHAVRDHHGSDEKAVDPEREARPAGPAQERARLQISGRGHGVGVAVNAFVDDRKHFAARRVSGGFTPNKIFTAEKRAGLLAIVSNWIDDGAKHGFDAIASLRSRAVANRCAHWLQHKVAAGAPSAR